MTIARAQLVDPSVSGVYHCISRCVRRAFLCGEDHAHRKDWIRSRLVHLADAFAIDVGGFAILDNHFHTILRTHPERASQWSNHQVARRWFRVFPESVRRWASQISLASPARGDQADGPIDDRTAIRLVAGDDELITTLRQRLASLSWFMKCLKERIAREANQEDGCRGHFWEARFRSPRILDATGLLATLIYVDLNVIRALQAMTPEASDHTSVQDRIHVRQLYEKQTGRRPRAPRRAAALLRRSGSRPGARMRSPEDCIWLAPIDRRAHADGLLDLSLDEYLTALDLSGRVLRAGNRGAIPAKLPPILERLGIAADHWREALQAVGRSAGTMVGKPAACAAEAARRGLRRVGRVVSLPSVAG